MREFKNFLLFPEVSKMNKIRRHQLHKNSARWNENLNIQRNKNKI